MERGRGSGSQGVRQGSSWKGDLAFKGCFHFVEVFGDLVWRWMVVAGQLSGCVGYQFPNGSQMVEV